MSGRNILWSLTLAISFFNLGYFYNEVYIIWDHLPCIYSSSGVTEDNRNDSALLAVLVNSGAAAIVCPIVGTFSKYNRRYYVLLTNLLILVSSCLMCIPNYHLLVICRIIRGVITGITSVIVPMFMNEILTPKQKVSWLGLLQVVLTGGPFCVYIIAIINPTVKVPDEFSGLDFCYSIEGKYILWRILFTLPIIPAAIQSLLLLFVFKRDSTELESVGDNEQPKHVNIQRGSEHSNVSNQEPLVKLKRTSTRHPTVLTKNPMGVKGDKNEVEFSNDEVTYSMLFSAKYRRTLLTGTAVAMFQQLSGINAISRYAYFVDIPGMNNYGYRFILVAVRMVFTMCVLYLYRVFGRKSLLLVGYLTSCLCNCILFQLFNENIDTGDDLHDSVVKILTIFVSLTFIIVFAVTVGPTSWVYMAETLPGKGLGIATCCLWTLNTLIAYIPDFFYSVIKIVDGYYKFDTSVSVLFFFFSGFSICGYFIVLVFVQETKGLAPNKINKKYDTFTQESESSMITESSQVF